MTGARVYYNEFNPYAAAWLKKLIFKRLVPAGDIDERDIRLVRPEDLRGYDQAHFFAGIGGWPLALALAGWPEGRPCWTGSCPCQPLSSAGAGLGADDERHVWPEWWRLIRVCRPPIVFGEQVASALGRTWFAAVRADLEALGYAVGAADLCAASVGAPHIRQRLYFVADAGRVAGLPEHRAQARGRADQPAADRARARASVEPRELADAGGDRAGQHAGKLPSDEGQHGVEPEDGDHASVAGRAARLMADAEGGGSGPGLRDSRAARQRRAQPADDGGLRLVADAERARREGLGGPGDDRDQPGRLGAEPPRPAAAASDADPLADADGARPAPQRGDEGEGPGGPEKAGQPEHAAALPRRGGGDGGLADADGGDASAARLQRGGEFGQREEDGRAGGRAGARPGQADGPWSAADWLLCRDDKWRPVEPGSFPLAHGLPHRLGALRAYGNAIVPPLAAEFIAAFLETKGLNIDGD